MGVVARVAPWRNVDVQKDNVVVLEDRDVKRRLVHGHRFLLNLRRRGGGQYDSKNGDECESGVLQGCLPGLWLFLRIIANNARPVTMSPKPNPNVWPS